MRVTVGMIVAQIGVGRSIEELLADFPYLEREDVLRATDREIMAHAQEQGCVVLTHDLDFGARHAQLQCLSACDVNASA